MSAVAEACACTPANALPTPAVPRTPVAPTPAVPTPSPDVARDPLATLASTPTGAWLLDQLRASGRMPAIRFAPDAEIDQEGRALNGYYEREANTVVVRDSLRTRNPSQFTTTLVHELFHAFDNARGLSGSIAPALDAQYRAAGWSDQQARVPQVKAHAKLITESRAYAFAAQFSRELGMPADDLGPVAIAAIRGSSPDQSYVAAWNAILTRDGIQGSYPIMYAPGTTTPY